MNSLLRNALARQINEMIHGGAALGANAIITARYRPIMTSQAAYFALFVEQVANGRPCSFHLSIRKLFFLLFSTKTHKNTKFIETLPVYFIQT
jgi:hypothetical protein